MTVSHTFGQSDVNVSSDVVRLLMLASFVNRHVVKHFGCSKTLLSQIYCQISGQLAKDIGKLEMGVCKTICPQLYVCP